MLFHRPCLRKTQADFCAVEFQSSAPPTSTGFCIPKMFWRQGVRRQCHRVEDGVPTALPEAFKIWDHLKPKEFGWIMERLTFLPGLQMLVKDIQRERGIRDHDSAEKNATNVELKRVFYFVFALDGKMRIPQRVLAGLQEWLRQRAVMVHSTYRVDRIRIQDDFFPDWTNSGTWSTVLVGGRLVAFGMSS